MKYFSKIADNLQKHIYFCLVASCSILLLAACADEPYETSAQTNEKQVEVKIFLTVPAPTIAQTREASTIVDDSYYNQDGVYVMIFNGNTDDSKLLQIAKASGSSKIFYAKLNGVDGACYAYVIANSEKIIQDNQESWNAGETTLGEIKSKLEYTLKTTGTSNIALTEMVTPQPMYTEVYLKDGISATTKIGTASESVKLTRSTAKISIYNETATGGVRQETLFGANLANAPVKGYLFPDNADLLKITRANTGLKGDFDEPIATPDAESNSCYLYTFESVVKEKASTSIIVKATYLGSDAYYYRIRLSNETDNYSLERNFNYIVHIKSILQKGYDSAQEALDNPAGNIEYTLSVTDAYSRDIVSNGEYYLGVENSEFYAFTDPSDGKEALKDQLVSIIMHNTKSVSGKFTVVEGNGLSIWGSDTFINNGAAGEQKVELRINADEGFTDGAIEVKLGDLTRTIKIHKRTMPNKFGSILDDFEGQGYISGTVAAKDAVWLKLTKKTAADGKAPKPEDLDDRDLFNSVESTNEKIYLRVEANIGDNTSADFREGSVDFFLKNEGGNARALIKQPVHDVYTDVVGQAKIAPYTYVGTFHRHDQIGERIIRVDTKIVGGTAARWRAFVVSGDFIRLSTTPSEDKGVGVKNFYGTADKGESEDNTTNFGYAVESFKLKDGKTDTGTIESGYIYFRVGLTTTIGANSVRYGLIGLQVNGDIENGTITRYIFVRQGEAADYLMRPEDPALKEPGKNNSVELSRRDQAIKLSPFNLTDADYSYNTDNISGMSDLTSRRGKMTDYPSQAGYLYQALSRRGWIADPSKTPDMSSFKSTNSKPVWDEAKYEICPEGYHRPEGGIEGKPDDNGKFTTNTDVSVSPVRQSLWLYPKNRGVNSTQNFIIGYIADGFYDRQPMWFANDGVNKLNENQPTAVNHGANIAYIGVLAFNPQNLASIFMPMTGYYRSAYNLNNQLTGKFQESSYSGSFYTKTRVGQESSGGYYTVDYGIMYGADEADMSDYMRSIFRVDNYSLHTEDYGNNIRCVKN